MSKSLLRGPLNKNINIRKYSSWTFGLGKFPLLICLLTCHPQNLFRTDLLVDWTFASSVSDFWSSCFFAGDWMMVVISEDELSVSVRSTWILGMWKYVHDLLHAITDIKKRRLGRLPGKEEVKRGWKRWEEENMPHCDLCRVWIVLVEAVRSGLRRGCEEDPSTIRYCTCFNEISFCLYRNSS